jgi:hypothetical protein
VRKEGMDEKGEASHTFRRRESFASPKQEENLLVDVRPPLVCVEEEEE